MRVVRTGVFAAVCVSLAGTGHALASAHPVSPGVLVAAFPVVAAGAWFAARRRRGTGTICAALLTAQWSLHVLLDRAHPPGHTSGAHPAASTRSPTAMGGHGTHLASHSAPVPVAEGASGAPGTVPSPASAVADILGSGDLAMTAAHLFAALGCAWWLARGEQAVARIAEAARAAVFRPLRTSGHLAPLPSPPRAAPQASCGTPRAHTRLLGHTLTRRGPPRTDGSLPAAAFRGRRGGFALPSPVSCRP